MLAGMHITLVSSLDALCRAPALDHLSSGRVDTAVVIHDLLENGTVVRQVFHDGRLLERHENLLEHGCLSCTVRLDVAPTVERLLADGYEHIIMGLPPTMAASMAVHGITQGVKSLFKIAAVVLACDPSSLEDQMWDRHTLFGSGYTAARKEERTAGEFLLEELSFSDTVFLAGPFPSSAGNHRGRSLLLLRELAPHSTLIEAGSTRSPARHDAAEARARSVPGTVRIPAADTSTVYTTVLHRVRRPLHPGRFRQALPQLAEGCVWLRGRLWMASAPTCRIAIQGIGPRVLLENTGPWAADLPDAASSHPAGSTDAILDWDPESGDRATVIAVTGEEIRPEELRELLDGCALTPAETAQQSGRFPDPFGLDTSESTEAAEMEPRRK